MADLIAIGFADMTTAPEGEQEAQSLATDLISPTQSR